MLTGQSPGEVKSREVELVSRSRMDCLAAELFLDSRFSDTVFVTLLHTAVETVISEMHKLLLTGKVPTSLTVLFCLAMADGLFGLYGSELWDELLISTRPLLFPSLISLMVPVDVKHR